MLSIKYLAFGKSALLAKQYLREQTKKRTRLPERRLLLWVLDASPTRVASVLLFASLLLSSFNAGTPTSNKSWEVSADFSNSSFLFHGLAVKV